MIRDWDWKWWSAFVATCCAAGLAISYPLVWLFESLHIYRQNVRGIT